MGPGRELATRGLLAQQGFQSTGLNPFLVRASGGVGINTNVPKAALQVRGHNTTEGTVFLERGRYLYTP